MMPEFPSLVLCKTCNQFYWVRKELQIEKIYDQCDLTEKYGDVDYLEFPTFYQYFKALDAISAERYIRMKIWWSFNDYFRDGHQSEITPEMQMLNRENLFSLLKILNETDNNDLLTKSEIFRELVWFDESKQILQEVESAELDWVKEKLLVENTRQNDQVFKLF